MLFLFKRKKININSVSIPDFGWTKSKDNKSIIQWINPEQAMAISINYFEMPPDIPTIKNLDVVRSFYRQSITNVNGGLIEVDLSKKDKISFVRTIVKLPQQPAGMTYVASLTIPFKKCSFVLKVQAAELGNTGMREALIANRLISGNMMATDENGNSNWSADPYDNNFKGGTLMNKSEQSCYDLEFPDHSLSKARRLLKQIENDMQLEAVLATLPAFDK